MTAAGPKSPHSHTLSESLSRVHAVERSLLSLLKSYLAPHVAAQIFALDPQMFLDPYHVRVMKWIVTGRPDPEAEAFWASLSAAPEPVDLLPALHTLYSARLAYELLRLASLPDLNGDMEELALSAMRRLRKIFARPGTTSGVEAMKALGHQEQVRYHLFDLESCPVPDGRFAILVAPTNTFKTASSVSEALRVAEAGGRVLLVSAEDSRASIMMRMVQALEPQYSVSQLIRMKAEGTLAALAQEVADRHQEVLSRIDVLSSDTELSVAVVARALALSIYDLLIIDNVYKLANPGRSIAEAHIELVSQIDMLIKEYQVPALLTTQMQAAAAREMWMNLRAGRPPAPAPQSVMGGAVYINDAVVGAFILPAFSPREMPSHSEAMAFFGLQPDQAWRAAWLNVVKNKTGPSGYHRMAFLEGRMKVDKHRVNMF
ncbi:MAG: AAA family ATPase [Anaerolineae bacterium]|nr:AAA family ATPase [Anaerolineae bacterium]